MEKKFRILIPEQLGDEGLGILKSSADAEADIRIGMSRDELLGIIADYDAIITRSATKMDAEMIGAGRKLRVIARAGVGVDNVDVQEASRHGIIVINAPTGNTLAAAELTIAHMLSVMRLVPYAHASVMSGAWDRKRFVGRQMSGKKLLVVGLGPIGASVAVRCRAFGMEIMGYDPYVSDKKMAEIGVRKVTDLMDSLSVSDVVTVHVPLVEETRGLISDREFRAIKHGAYVINCARGGIIDESACAEALRSGRIAGAAFDVYTTEPPAADNPLLAEDIRDKIILTPHLGASTVEAQGAVSQIAVENTLAALRGGEYQFAVNLPFMEQNLGSTQRNYLRLARKMGLLAGRMIERDGGAVTACRVRLRGTLLCDDETPPNKKRPYTVAVLKGMLEVSNGPDTNYMIAPLIAAERGISVEETTAEPVTYRNLIEVELDAQNAKTTIVGTITEEGEQHIVRIDDYWINFVPRGTLLVFRNHDRPGVIGRMGMMLGDARVNIANFTLGRKEGSGLALAVMEVDGAIPDDVMREIEDYPDMVWAAAVSLGEDAQ